MKPKEFKPRDMKPKDLTQKRLLGNKPVKALKPKDLLDAKAKPATTKAIGCRLAPGAKCKK